jgi:hypothetical protein
MECRSTRRWIGRRVTAAPARFTGSPWHGCLAGGGSSREVHAGSSRWVTLSFAMSAVAERI